MWIESPQESGGSIKLATDCSGLDAAYYALKNIIPAGTRIDYRFASDINPTIRNILAATTKPVRIFEDVTKRDVSILEHVDVYVAGFPCQSFSALGKQEGFDCTNGRVFPYIYEYIRLHQPKVFVLENVRSLLVIDNGNAIAEISRLLAELGTYDVCYRILTPLQIGFPHSRRRLFILGMLRSMRKRTSYTHSEYDRCSPLLPASSYPAEVRDNFESWNFDDFDHLLCATQMAVHIDDILLSREQVQWVQPRALRPITKLYRENLETLHEKRPNAGETTHIVDLKMSKRFFKLPPSETCPCLTTWCMSYYVSSQRRFLTAVEAMCFQGLTDLELIDYMRNHCTQTDTYHMAGNSICVPLLTQILQSLFTMVGVYQ